MFKNSSISTSLMYSFQSCLDDLFIDSGAFFDIEDSSNSTGNFSILKKISHPHYTDGRVWAARRKNFIWEPSGIQISGVWVNGSLLTSGYDINYRDGYVLFDNPTSGTIKLNYSYKYIEVVNSEESDALKIDYRSSVINDSQYVAGSGIINLSKRVQLPCVCIEPVATSKTEAFEIGSRTKIHTNEMIVHVLSEDGIFNNEIRDYIADLEESSIGIYDYTESKRAGDYPLNRKGFLVNKTAIYDILCNHYPFRRAKNKTIRSYIEYFIDSSGNFVVDSSGNYYTIEGSGFLSDTFITKVVNEGCTKLPNSLHHGTLRITFETILSV